MRMASDTQKFQTAQLALLLCLMASAAMLLGALAFEHIGGLAPCKLCIWQRWPHLVIIIASLFGLASSRWTGKHAKFGPAWLWVSVIILLAFTTSGIGLYHVGVEQSWWEGPSGCSSQLGANLDLSTLTDTLLAMPVVRCDEIAWQLFGISMAGWNALLSLGIAGIGIFGLKISLTQRTV